MDGSRSGEEMARQNLLDRILNCVKQVQVHFGAKQEIATESDSRVSAMCIEWEAVLTHAAKKPKPKNSLRLTGRQEGVSLWPLAKVSVSAEDLQRFSRLEHIKTEVGRGRAWLRAAINERTLENYLHIMLSQEEELRKLYEGHAFVLDQERSSMLPVMAAGLSSIIFSIAVDVPYLNTSSRSVEAAPGNRLDAPEAQVPVAPPTSSRGSRSSNSQHSSKSSLHSVPELSEGSRTTLQPHPLPTAAQSDFSSRGDDDVIAVNVKEKKKRTKKSKSKSSSSIPPSHNGAPHVLSPQLDTPESVSPVAGSPRHSSPYSDHSSLPVPQEPEGAGLRDNNSGFALRESASSSSSRLSLDEDGSAPTFVALPQGHALSSEVQAAADATAQLLSALATPRPVGEEHLAVGGANEAETQEIAGLSSTHYLSTAKEARETTPPSETSELRTAMLSLSRSKEQLERRNRELTETVHQLEQRVESLSVQAEQAKQSSRQLQDAHAGKMQALERENDLLREQLKKYVSMVQTQWKDSPSKHTSSAPDAVVGGQSPDKAELDEKEQTEMPSSQDLQNHYDATEQKLQQMAEMYADLMELNDRLHRDLAEKDSTIATLVRSLKESSLELPVPVHQLPPSAMETKALVDVWIPSVIKKGRGPDGFHVYQVFVCVKAVEWNIYRRYTEFREFHRQLQKCIPELHTFNFPPKRALGSKSAQVVEDRRLRLQEFLRLVIKTCSSPRKGKGGREKQEPIITAAITKATLVTIFPFFKEDFNTESAPVPDSPSYSGL